MEEIEVLELCFTFVIDGETWQAVSFWEWPKQPRIFEQLVRSVAERFHKETESQFDISKLTKFKARGQRIKARGLEAKKVRAHLAKADMREIPTFTLVPILVNRYMTNGGN